MAALQNIRKRGTIIAIVIGFALLAFVLTDFINSSSSFFRNDQLKMAEINGESIDYNDFQNLVQEREQFYKIAFNRSTLDGKTSDEIRAYVWENLVSKYTIGKSVEALGLSATPDELVDMINTGMVTPMISQGFVNENGVYDPAMVQRFLSEDQNGKNEYIWHYLEQELKENREYSKYISMVSSGLYVTDAEVRKEFAERTHMVDFKYVALPYSEIPDSEVSVSDQDIKAYYDQNKATYYRQIESRDVAYVTFDIVASQADSAKAMEIIQECKPGFVSATDVPSYVNSKSDVPYVDMHYSKGDFSNKLIDSLMFSNNTGFVYGPYVDGEFYSMARIIDSKSIPDSVKVSHILCAIGQDGDTLAPKHRADSLLQVIKSGVEFKALASQFSDDKTSAKDSGNIGWITENVNFVPEFKSAAFKADVNVPVIVKSNYGYHIIKVTQVTSPKTKVSVGILKVEIRPGSETGAAAYALASEFSGKNRTLDQFNKAVEAQKLTRRVAPNLTSSARGVAGIENSREFVRWAFDEEKSKSVSDIMQFDERYVVACVDKIHSQGIPELSDVKDNILPEVTAIKKGEKIITKFAGRNITGVDAFASENGKAVSMANSVSFNQYQINGIGYEPAVMACATEMQKDAVSKLIAGKNAVYLIQNTSYTPAQQIQDLNITTDKSAMENDLRSRATYQLNAAIIQMSDLKDLRYKFF